MTLAVTPLPADLPPSGSKDPGKGSGRWQCPTVEVELEGKWKLEGRGIRYQPDELIERLDELILQNSRSMAPTQRQACSRLPIHSPRAGSLRTEYQHHALPMVRRRRARSLQALVCTGQWLARPDVSQTDAEPEGLHARDILSTLTLKLRESCAQARARGWRVLGPDAEGIEPTKSQNRCRWGKTATQSDHRRCPRLSRQNFPSGCFQSCHQ
jgi:hypothetical protein